MKVEVDKKGENQSGELDDLTFLRIDLALAT